MLSWMNPCYLQSICNLTEFVSHSVTPGSLKRVLEKYAKRCALESVKNGVFNCFIRPKSIRKFKFFGWINISCKVNSVQEAFANALRFRYQKSCKSYEKNKLKNIRLLVLSFSSIDLVFWCFLFWFFVWSERFQRAIFQIFW